MIQNHRFRDGDLFIDFDVKGHVLSRRGLDALIEEANHDEQVSHVLIPRRDRLARPDDPLDGIRLEDRLHEIGVTLVFIDRISPPTPIGSRKDVTERICALIEYDQSGQFLQDLAYKMIVTQINLAKSGYSTGGRPPYGFRRWLVKADGTKVQELREGLCVRTAGHHVVWLPGPEEELAVIRRIISMLEAMPASRVAAVLTAEKVPTPDAGRYRTDNGVKHLTSGVWHATTIINIARNRLLVAIATYGRRSMGDHLRLSSNGPRKLRPSDFRKDRKRKVIANGAAEQIIASGHFAPIIEPDRHQRLLEILDARAGTQRGKPRSRDPNRNPLGGRVFDMKCGWPMYRRPDGEGFRYVCGLYGQSKGQRCDHNNVDGPTAARFVADALRQLVYSRQPQLKARLRELAQRNLAVNDDEDGMAIKERRLVQVIIDLKKAQTNLSRAESDAQYKAVAEDFEQLRAQSQSLQSEIADLKASRNRPSNVDAEVQSALAVVDRFSDFEAANQLAALTELFTITNARLFLRFKKVQLKKRSVNKLACGVLTIGAVPPPIELYSGPTSRMKIGLDVTPQNTENPSCDSFVSGSEGNSLGNVNRGDRI
jgi:hypothetical protein